MSLSVKVQSKGMKWRMLTNEIPWLGLLHLYLIRGWAAILCHLGITAFKEGVGAQMIVAAAPAAAAPSGLH